MPSKKVWQNYKHYHDTAVNQKQYGGANDYIRGIFGGPVGWAELASGHGILGDTFGEHKADVGLSEEDFNLMTDDEMQQYERMNQNERAAFLDQIRAERAGDKAAQDKQAAEEKKLKDEQDARDVQQKSILDKVQKFADEMNMPVSELMQRDDFAKALNAHTYQNAMADGMGTGAGMGGLSVANADQATKNALLGYQMQRQQMGQQAYDRAYGMIDSQNQRAEDLYRYNQGMNMQMDALRGQAQYNSYQQKLGQSGQTLGLIGGVVGAYFGGAAGGQAGYQIGSGIGQQNYQQSNPYRPYKYSYPSGSRPSGGLGGGGYGNNGGSY